MKDEMRQLILIKHAAPQVVAGTPPAQPVIPYADATVAANAIVCRDTDDGGVEYVVAPQEMWRQVFVPAAGLAVFTAFTGLHVVRALLFFFYEPSFAFWLGAIAIGAFGVWILMFARLWRRARYGRLVSLISASPSGLQVVVPSLPQGTHQTWARSSIGDIRIQARNAVPGRFQVIRVFVTYRGGMTTDIRIPWRGGVPIEPVERRVREVLGLTERPGTPGGAVG